MSIYVVDASVAAKWFFEEDHTESALRLFGGDNQLHAPDFMLLELDSVLCKKIRLKELISKDALEIRSALRTFPITRHPFGMLMDPAFELAHQTQSSPYDCLYLVLAMLLHGELVTADRRFYNIHFRGPFFNHLCWVEDLP
ncbi:MAG: type II toxin-antitoxin system VapC family toxin [Deltaproteobacteria bacterium]|nr:type II toxin-antitoxin system VapC family toxin [Deltaproteobacteria bacterium]